MENHKFKIMEEEISKLIDYAFDHGMEKGRIRELALLSYEEYLIAKKRKNNKVKLLVIFVVCLITVITCYLCCTSFGFALLRISLIKLLPLWDFTSLYKKNCLVTNPFYDANWDPQAIQDCSTCSGVQIIPRFESLSAKEVLHKHLIPKVPVIISEAINDWPAKTHFSLQFLMKLFMDDPILSSTPPCLLFSNIDDPVVHPNLHSIANYLTYKHNDLTSFYVHWENCDKRAIKVLRGFFRRPSIVHSSVEVEALNWLVVSSNYDAAEFVTAELEAPISWFVQVKGSFKVRLQPSTSCNTSCHTLYTVLREGDIVLWTQPQWQFAYKPMKESQESHSISVLFGGFLV